VSLKTYIFYQKASPFPGWIRFTGQTDISAIPDGSTFLERLNALKIKYPDSELVFFPQGKIVDPEAIKYDELTSSLIPLEPKDITPEKQKLLDNAAKTQPIINNMPSWAHVETAVNNIANLADAKAFLLKLSLMAFWLAKNKAN